MNIPYNSIAKGVINSYLELLKLRKLDYGRFFKGINGTTKQLHKLPMGINSFYKVPFLIAVELGLVKPSGFTGHCFRRIGFIK